MALQHLRSSTADKRPNPASLSDGQIAINTNAASPGLFFKSSTGTLLKTGPVHIGTTAPNSSPAGSSGVAVGEQWLDTTSSNYTLKVWDGSAWRTVLQLTDSTSSTSTNTAATPNSVKSAYDLADAALPKAGGTLTGDVDNSSTGYFDLPTGTTAQRPGTANSGMIRFNSELTQFEGHNGTTWGTIGGGATGGGSDQVFYENDQAVTTDYTLTTSKNAVTAGPVTINAGVTVTVPTGSNWVVI